MATRTAIGVDLGATNVVVSWVNSRGETEILLNSEGKASMPAAVYLADDRTIVGEEALLRGRRHPERLAAHIKADLGSRWYHSAIGGVHVPPEALQACILRQLRLEWDRKFLGSKVVTIAVPAIFNDVQRRATIEAARLAGITNVEIIDEPLAAALAYAEKIPQSFVGEEQSLRKILVLNMGGQATEASVLSLNFHGLSALATEGDPQLGGHDWDLCLARRVAEEVSQLAGRKWLMNPGLRFRILEFSQKAKLALSSRPATHLTLQVGERTHKIEVTREKFNAAMSELVTRVELVIQGALSAAHLDWHQLDGTLLVGGASQLPAIRELLEQRTGRLPEAWISPYEAVARGAARHAFQRLHSTMAPMPAIHSQCTHSLGVEWEEPITKQKMRKTLIRRGTPLPTEVTRELIMRGAQRKSIVLSLWQGDAENAQHRTLIGRAVLEDLPADLAEDWPIDLKLEMGINGRIAVDASVRYTKCIVHLVMQRPDFVSATHFNLWQQIVESLSGLPAYVEAGKLEDIGGKKIPVVITSSHPAEASVQEDSEPQAVEENRLLALLRRLMPFHRGATQLASTSEAAVAAPVSGDQSARRTPPALEVIEMHDEL
ncbi:Chaperone protein DnaK [Anatilimnocola aggregata]|uniref:Chaperone protein DnaK n=1 Tax=Anatilimnocola aggregata TaxID=2528021 RepID=A0A517YAF3_9BACT|nr:Hsp70 family protein [Anatilimnocola aggregata]QDU27209.1 Chaperone protein DnaK [Anatilimnocola aggregata]